MNEQESWIPNAGPQTQALRSCAFETLYGGARGGGKTDAGIVWLLKTIKNPKFRGLVIRRNADDLSDWLDRAQRLYRRYGAEITGQPHTIRFPSGAVIRTGHLKDDQAYTKYQGHEYQRMLIEELTQIPDEKRYLQLLGSCRSTLPEIDARVFGTTNPGGVGHSWVKKRFVDLAPWGKVFKDPDTGRTRVFIPARVEDTPQLVKNDPGYLAFLEGLKVTNVELWKAWRLGDWDTFAGQVFSEFRRSLHQTGSIYLKKEYPIMLSFDWGYAAPFACYAHTLLDMKTDGGMLFKRLVTWKEWYGTEKTPALWAETIYNDAKKYRVIKAVCDPSMLNRKSDGSRPIMDEFHLAWKRLSDGDWMVPVEGGSKDRIKRVALTHSWLSVAPDGLPYWLISTDCNNLLRTLPGLVYDENHKEDVDTNLEDHAYDSCSYLLSTLQYLPQAVGQFSSKYQESKIVEMVDAEGRGVMPFDVSEFENMNMVN